MKTYHIRVSEQYIKQFEEILKSNNIPISNYRANDLYGSEYYDVTHDDFIHVLNLNGFTTFNLINNQISISKMRHPDVILHEIKTLKRELDESMIYYKDIIRDVKINTILK